MENQIGEIVKSVIRQLEGLTELSARQDVHPVETKPAPVPLCQPKAEYKNNIGMGIGPLGKPTNVFPRSFRFTLSAKGCEFLEWFTVCATIDYKNKTLYFEVYEVVSSNEGDYADKLDKWVRELIDRRFEETLTLTTYDGCGTPLYEIVFDGIEVESHQMNFDYSKSDVSTQKLTVKFETFERKVLAFRDKGENNGTKKRT